MTLSELREGDGVGFGGDCQNPDWNAAGRVHDWRNYISEDVQAIWHTFTACQRRALALNAEEIADREEWD